MLILEAKIHVRDDNMREDTLLKSHNPVNLIDFILAAVFFSWYSPFVDKQIDTS